MNFHKYSQKVIILAAVIWAILAVCTRMGILALPLSVLYIYFGAIICYLGIQNLIILNISAKKGIDHEKIKQYDERFGKKYGLIYYVIISVLFFIIFGIIVMACGFLM